MSSQVQSFIRDLQKKRKQVSSVKKRDAQNGVFQSGSTKRPKATLQRTTHHFEDRLVTKSVDSHRAEKKPKETDFENKKLHRQQRDIGDADSSELLPAPERRRPKPIPFDHRYILAPMVGASELAFRLLCRKYGAQVAYTPMMSAPKFATDPSYRSAEFQTCAADRPLVCHFAANDAADFAAAAIAAQPFCDAIDLNLGCPQRTAYLGHFGSYLLDRKDRSLICDIVRAGAAAVSIPIFVKIRLLDKVEETIELCQQLERAGASLIAVHARYRASWERKGAGARDGPALLDQIAVLKQHITSIPIIANGNVITYDDVEKNLELTGADGVMSAEGILDNPALFLPRLGNKESEGDRRVQIPMLDTSTDNVIQANKKRKLEKKLSKISKLERKVQEHGQDILSEAEKEKLFAKERVLLSFEKLEAEAQHCQTGTRQTSLRALYDVADSKLKVASEYLDLATIYPVKIRSVVFHTRRILKDVLMQYQLLEECLACETIDKVRSLLQRIAKYQTNPETFVFDQEKAKREKKALELKKREEGKRKEYEARMVRKAKREGLTDLTHYLQIGADVPTRKTVQKLKTLSKEEAMAIWKGYHSQHCLSFHLESNGCARGRSCAFLHVDILGSNAFVEKDEVAG